MTARSRCETGAGWWYTLERDSASSSHWYNHRRLFGPLGHVLPAAFEAHYNHQLRESAMAA